MNDITINQYTLHSGTGEQCTLDPNAAARYRNEDGSQSKCFLGNPLGLDCQSSDSSNAGCAVNDFEGSAGAPFNQASGGVLAMLWDDTQVSLWRFERAQIPQDIQAGNPDPVTWGIPVAYWSNQTCNIASTFQDHSSMFHSTFSLIFQGCS